jgi:hypothetical protein
VHFLPRIAVAVDCIKQRVMPSYIAIGLLLATVAVALIGVMIVMREK